LYMTKRAISKRFSWHQEVLSGSVQEKGKIAAPLNIDVIASKVVLPCFFIVETQPLVRQKNCAPKMLRKQPETFCLTLFILISRSPKLLVKGTEKSNIKDSVSIDRLDNRSHKFLLGCCFFLPRFLEAVSRSGISFNPS